MDKATLIGLIVGITSIIISILLGGSLMGFVDFPSIFIVFGGTTSALLINYPMGEVVSLTKYMGLAMKENQSSLKEIIEELVAMSEKARREGILAIEQALNNVSDPFMKSGLRLAVDGSEPEAIKESMEIEMANVGSRHKKAHDILDSGAAFGPAFGMVGTLIGLVNMLKNMSDPSSIGPAMAVALLTTLYGALLANLFFLPLRGKIVQKSNTEMIQKELIIEGVIGIQGGENPRMLRSKLETYLKPSERTPDKG
ncbi:MAG: MotA/TolQ/ExbB proton channel family protein [Candidatus Delongbacteria bacterium]|nr:MotA/TolQ/ExbB proton channel family protein [Candidatus Delongbacteria bacterium]MBN2834718.1 MotA/TolQ/ExbB proton channel family protein [Candidatus Delongbacteria bacterium]